MDKKYWSNFAIFLLQRYCYCPQTRRANFFVIHHSSCLKSGEYYIDALPYAIFVPIFGALDAEGFGVEVRFEALPPLPLVVVQGD